MQYLNRFVWIDRTLNYFYHCMLPTLLYGGARISKDRPVQHTFLLWYSIKHLSNTCIIFQLCLNSWRALSRKAKAMAKDLRPSGSRPSVELDLVPCQHCGRTFTPDRLDYHESVCLERTSRKKREPYDSVAHRWKGTDNEPAVQWLKNNPPGPPVRSKG